MAMDVPGTFQRVSESVMCWLKASVKGSLVDISTAALAIFAGDFGDSDLLGIARLDNWSMYLSSATS